MVFEDHYREFSGTSLSNALRFYCIFTSWSFSAPVFPARKRRQTQKVSWLSKPLLISHQNFVVEFSLCEIRGTDKVRRITTSGSAFLRLTLRRNQCLPWFPMVGILEWWGLCCQQFIETQPNLKGSSIMVGGIVSQLCMCKILYKNICTEESLSFIPFAHRNVSNAIQFDRKRGGSTLVQQGKLMPLTLPHSTTCSIYFVCSLGDKYLTSTMTVSRTAQRRLSDGVATAWRRELFYFNTSLFFFSFKLSPKGLHQERWLFWFHLPFLPKHTVTLHYTPKIYTLLHLIRSLICLLILYSSTMAVCYILRVRIYSRSAGSAWRQLTVSYSRLQLLSWTFDAPEIKHVVWIAAQICHTIQYDRRTNAQERGQNPFVLRHHFGAPTH